MVQEEFNRAHGIEPRSIKKAIRAGIADAVRSQRVVREAAGEDDEAFEVRERIRALEEEMLERARALDFESAAEIRDRIEGLRAKAKAQEAGGEAPPPALAQSADPRGTTGRGRSRRPRG
jgi:excinuclease ABC subunit B